MSGDEVYLRHILDAIHRIESYISKGRESFLSDQMPQDAVMLRLRQEVERMLADACSC